MQTTDGDRIVRATRAWLTEVVVGLNLCPFAKQPLSQERIRLVVSSSDSESELLMDLADELRHLTSTPTTETTLLIHPNALTDFLDYNDFLALCDALVADMSLEGIVQIASFHPGYQFADAAPEAIENYTNRSPFPMLHLLREESISAALAEYPDPEGIPERNIAKLRGLPAAAAEKLIALTDS